MAETRKSWPFFRVLRALLGSAVGAFIGGVLGLAWFNLFDSSGSLESIISGLAGGLAGASALGSFGWSWEEFRQVSPERRAASLLGWLSCGALLTTGVTYIGGWTNSEGPDVAALIGILGIPTSLLGIRLIARWLRRSIEPPL